MCSQEQHKSGVKYSRSPSLYQLSEVCKVFNFSGLWSPHLKDPYNAFRKVLGV